MARDYGEDLEKRLAEEALDRKAKAGIQANNYNCSIKAAKFKLKKETTIKEVRCKKCGKIFKTNRDTQLCLSCERKKN
jgi:hypothetical protein